MKFYHWTNEDAWKKIQEDGYLWGHHGGDGTYRYTYLAPDPELWKDPSYGNVLLEVEYEPKREDASQAVGGTIPVHSNSADSVKHNFGFDPPPGQRCIQFSVFEKIPLINVRRIYETT